MLGEALVLGFSSGPVCLASCGPVLLPWLAAEGRRVSGTAALVAGFLGGRLAGYLLFAAAAWTLGAAAAPSPRIRAIVFGAAHVGIAAVLLAYAPRPRTCADGCGLSRPRRPAAGSVALGLLTGVNLCAPFLAAAVRASESPGPGGALLFFSAYFAGTSLWFLPAVGAGWLARLEGAARAARYAMALLALYYGYRGLITLFGGALHA